jgi:hypothetical protein
VEAQGLEALRAELQAARPPLVGIMEGLRHDLEQQDLEPRDRAEVEALLADYMRREDLMMSLDAHASGTFDAVAALLADGYPALPEREISEATFEALDQNRRSIELAQRQFRPRAITTTGTSTVGPEEPSVANT